MRVRRRLRRVDLGRIKRQVRRLHGEGDVKVEEEDDDMGGTTFRDEEAKN